jgi:hypothetical protein
MGLSKKNWMSNTLQYIISRQATFDHKSPLSMEISASSKKSLVDNTPSNSSMNNSRSIKSLWNDDEEYHSKMDQIGSFKMIIDHNDDSNDECNANYDAHPIVAADADNPNQHLKARSLGKSASTRKFNQMITRIISNRKSKTRKRSAFFHRLNFQRHQMT